MLSFRASLCAVFAGPTMLLIKFLICCSVNMLPNLLFIWFIAGMMVLFMDSIATGSISSSVVNVA